MDSRKIVVFHAVEIDRAGSATPTDGADFDAYADRAGKSIQKKHRFRRHGIGNDLQFLAVEWKCASALTPVAVVSTAFETAND